MMALLSTLFVRVLQASFAASLLILALFALKAVFRNKLSPQPHYWIWILVMLKLLFPYLPKTQFVYPHFTNNNLVQHYLQTAKSIRTANLLQPIEQAAGILKKSIQKNDVNQTAGYSSPIFHIALILWLTGLFLVLIILALVFLRLQLKILGKGNEVEEPQILKILDECKSQMKITRKVRILYVDHVRSPAITGILHPNLLLPRDLLDRIELAELKYILLHELTHMRRFDALTNSIMFLLTAIHWFNPLVWLAYRQMQTDREISCDEVVMSYINGDETQNYGEVLIKVLTSVSPRQKFAPHPGLIHNKSEYRRRITMIKAYKKTGRSWLSLGIATLLLSGIFIITSAEAPQQAAKKAPIYPADSQTITMNNAVGAVAPLQNTVNVTKLPTPSVKKAYSKAEYSSQDPQMILPHTSGIDPHMLIAWTTHVDPNMLIPVKPSATVKK